MSEEDYMKQFVDNFVNGLHQINNEQDRKVENLVATIMQADAQENGSVPDDPREAYVRGIKTTLRSERKPDTNYEQLFGTPEKMAQTLAKALAECDEYGWHCDRCDFSLAPFCPRRLGSGAADYDTLLEWLIGDEQHGDKAVTERDVLIRDIWSCKKEVER